MIINAPSIANCNILSLADEIEQLIQGHVNFLHIDLMDGHYVPNLFFPTHIVKAIHDKYPDVTLDVHLMVDNPQDYITQLKEYGADYVSFHIDSTSFSIRTLRLIHDKGMKAGIVINPSQRIDIIEPVIDYVDNVVLMTVEPGFAGQQFMNGSLERLEELVELKNKHNKQFSITVDGGVDYPNAFECVKIGADILITGIYTIFNQEDGLKDACLRFENEINGL